MKTRVPGRISETDPKLGLQQQAGQNQQVEADDREVDVLLEVGPAFPGAASGSEDPLEPRDAALDAGPETAQLAVDPRRAHHLRDLQPAFLGKNDILDPLLLGPGQIRAAGKAAVATDLSRPATVQIMLALEPGLELSGIVGVSSHDLRIQHQAGGAASQK